MQRLRLTKKDLPRIILYRLPPCLVNKVHRSDKCDQTTLQSNILRIIGCRGQDFVSLFATSAIMQVTPTGTRSALGTVTPSSLTSVLNERPPSVCAVKEAPTRSAASLPPPSTSSSSSGPQRVNTRRCGFAGWPAQVHRSRWAQLSAVRTAASWSEWRSPGPA